MKKLLPLLLSTTCASLAVPAFAQDVPPPLPAETISVAESIYDGPNLFVLDQSWDGASTLQIYDAETLHYKGGLGTGMMAQFVVSEDGETAYTISTYLRRITYGDTEMVLQVFDVDTLSVTQEILLPPKIVMVGPYEHLLQLSADERFAFVMNATPATSVTVVDLESGAVTTEVPTPGCYAIYPAMSGVKFTMLCGDGSAQTFVLDETGTTVASQNSLPLFDVDNDALFIHAERGMGDELLFVSFTGNVYRLSDAGDTPELLETFSIVDDVDAPFAPTGYALSAYNAANDMLFVAMHADPYDGSHKDAATEVWAIDMANDALAYRMQPEEGIISMWVSDDEDPTLYAFNEHDYTVRTYAIDPDAPFGIFYEETGMVGVNGGQVLAVRP